jgi:hypothetical protein
MSGGELCLYKDAGLLSSSVKFTRFLFASETSGICSLYNLSTFLGAGANLLILLNMARVYSQEVRQRKKGHIEKVINLEWMVVFEFAHKNSGNKQHAVSSCRVGFFQIKKKVWILLYFDFVSLPLFSSLTNMLLVRMIRPNFLNHGDESSWSIRLGATQTCVYNSSTRYFQILPHLLIFDFRAKQPAIKWHFMNGVCSNGYCFC